MTSVKTTIKNIQPYHSILGNDAQTTKIRNEMHEKLRNLGTGFFAGMGLKSIDVKQFKKESSLISSTFVVEVSYRIQFPIRFLGSDQPTILTINSKSIVPITDTGEFILNVDMAMDYFDSSGLKDKLAEMSKALPFIGK